MGTRFQQGQQKLCGFVDSRCPRNPVCLRSTRIVFRIDIADHSNNHSACLVACSAYPSGVCGLQCDQKKVGNIALSTGSGHDLILIPVGIDAGYYLRLWSFQNYYEAEVAKLPKDNNPRFRLFDWGGYFIFNTIVLAYDESDELSLAPGKQSPEWTARTNERTGGFFGGKWTAEHLQGHYYVVTTY